jgi:hypothetical protein
VADHDEDPARDPGLAIDDPGPGDSDAPSGGREWVESNEAPHPRPLPRRGGARVTCLADVQPETVAWLWSGWFPLGKMSILDGDPALGKSTVTLDLTARVSTGAPMPDGSPGVSGAVVLMSCEDGLADTIAPRLEAAGADRSRVHAFTMAGADGVERLPTLPDDLAELERVVRETGAVLVVVDPLVAFLGSETDAHRDQDVRRALAPLAALAERTGAAVVGIRHLNKMAGGPSIYRGGGSIAFTGAARAVHLVARDPDDSDARIMAPVKSNLGPKPGAMRYRLESRGAVARVAWLGTCDADADALVALPKPGNREDRKAMDEARDFLVSVLEAGPKPAREVLKEGKRAGLAADTLKRAKRTMGVKPKLSGFGGAWTWELPESQSAAYPRSNNTLDAKERAAGEKTNDSDSVLRPSSVLGSQSVALGGTTQCEDPSEAPSGNDEERL